MSVMVFLNEASIWISGFIKIDYSSHCRFGIMQSIENLKRTKCRGWKNWPFLNSWLISWVEALNFSLVFLILRLSDPDWNLHHWLPWFLGLQTWTELYHQLSWVFNLQIADHVFLSILNYMNPFKNIYISSYILYTYTYTCVYLYTHIYMYIHYIYIIYIHTHTHTHTKC